MNFQSICAAIEIPIYKAFSDQSPETRLFFDNVIPVSPDPPSEYAVISISLGSTSEATLNGYIDRARGAIVMKIYTPKNEGGLRSRQLAAIARSSLSSMNSVNKADHGVTIRVHNIDGPSFSQGVQLPHFIARIEATWHATSIN